MVCTGCLNGKEPHRLMVNMQPLSVVDRWFELRSGQIKDYRIGICCFSAKHAALGVRAKTGWL
jgi:hypothetical protein